jgi:hypothetical protein
MKQISLVLVFTVSQFLLLACVRNAIPPISKPVEKAPTIQDVELGMCWNCQTKAQVDSFERVIGGRKIDLAACQAAQIFMNVDCDESDSRTVFSGQNQALSLLSYNYGIVDIYMQPRASDSMPLVLVLVLYNTQDERLDGIPVDTLGKVVSELVIKYTWREPLLEELGLIPPTQNFEPDTTWVLSVFENIRAQLHREFQKSDSSAFARPETSGFFYEDRGGAFYSVEHYKFEGFESGNDIYGSAPYRDLYKCFFHSDSLLNAEGGFLAKRYMNLCLGWGAPEVAYVRKDTVGVKKREYYDIRPKDLAIYFGYRSHR